MHHQKYCPCHNENLFLVQDYSQQPPAQELIAKDLHGNEWKFRHVFRGKIYSNSFSSLMENFLKYFREVAIFASFFLKASMYCQILRKRFTLKGEVW